MTRNREPEGNAIVYCNGAFRSTYGKTAHGLVRFTRRYKVLAVVDPTCAGRDAGEVLDGKASNIPIVDSIDTAVDRAREAGTPATHLVIGLAPDGGRLAPEDRTRVMHALELGLNIDSGLHQYFSEDAEMAALAALKGCILRDVRKPPPVDRLHFFTGKIDEVNSLKIAILGTDSAIGKRTTAWLLVQALEAAGISAELIGTGQTAWMQGATFGLVLDSLVCDFVTGEIEHAAWRAWKERRPEIMVFEGQGSLMNPAYPGGLEILAAGRPDIIILQHAPARLAYDGFPNYPLHPLVDQIRAAESLSGKPVVAITLNHEEISEGDLPGVARATSSAVGLPVFDVLRDGASALAELAAGWLARRGASGRKDQP